MVGVRIAEYSDSLQVGVTGAAGCAFRSVVLENALNADASPAAIDAVSIDLEYVAREEFAINEIIGFLESEVIDESFEDRQEEAEKTEDRKDDD